MKITSVRTRVVEWRGKTVPLAPHFCTNPMDLVPQDLIHGNQASMATFTFHGWLIVEVFTDAGHVGIGNAALSPYVTKAVIDRHLTPLLLGQDPWDLEFLWQHMYRKTMAWGRKGLGMVAISAVDLALWDALGKALGAPVHDLLGGRRSETIRVYASRLYGSDSLEDLAAEAQRYVDEGFTAFKLHAWGDAKEDAKLSRNLRKWTGPDSVLMFDGSAGWDYVTSLWFGRVMEECGFYWYEEPMREFELGSYRKLCDALDVPVLAAETSDGAHWNAASWVQAGALDMLRTNPTMKGGMTGALKIVHLAECHGMKAQVHGMGLPQAHICGAIPNNDFYEELVISSQQISGLKNGSHGMKIVGGKLTVPSTPGLGYEPDWTWIEKTALASV